ncbi:MAG: PHP domain-containing protein, partial [bacterium]
MSPCPPACDYVELRCRSAFSFLEASSNPEDLAAVAAERGHCALALADDNGLYGIPRFHLAARAVGLRAIVGATLQVAREERPGTDALLLLVETPRGYRNLARLLTCGHVRAGKEQALVSWSEVEEHASDLTALVRGDARLTPALLDRARAHFPGRLWAD